MPRGDNPNSRKNLEKGTPFNEETASEAGKKSVNSEKRKEKKLLKECLEILLDRNINIKDGETTRTVNGAEAVSIALFRKALKGDTRAFEILRDTIGQKPVEKVVVSDINPDVISEVESLVKELEGSNYNL